MNVGQCAIGITANVPLPPGRSDARTFVTNDLTHTREQATLLGEGFFGCMHFRRSDPNIEQDIAVEPLLADQRFLFVNLTVQRPASERDIDELAEWIDDGFEFVNDRAMALLETSRADV